MHSRNRALWLIIALLPLACALPTIATPIAPGTGGGSGGPVFVFAPANATPTATPFQPSAPTPTYIPTNQPTPTVFIPPTAELPEIVEPVAKSWDDYPGPTVWPDIDIPAPTGILAQPEGQVTILLLGSDQRPSDGGLRTDTILLLTLNTKEGTVNITSFPRDLYVYIPGWTVQRINTAYGFGGFESLALTLEYNFGVHPDHYVMINFSSFKEVIDSLGGINVNVAAPLTDHRDAYGDYTVPAGIVTMDGETALWYVRARYTTSDFDRGRRQQEVLQAIFEKLLSLDAIERAPDLYDIYRQNVTTDMTFDQMAELAPLAVQLRDTSRIHHYFIGPETVMNWVNYSGAQVLLPIRDAVLEVMKQALNSP